MGCIQSIRCKPKSFRDSIIVLEVNTSIDPNPTSIDESSSVVLRYRTPHFRACARVLVPPVAGKETWTIGWIQACNHMEFYNTYGNKGMWVSSALLYVLLFQALSNIIAKWWANSVDCAKNISTFFLHYFSWKTTDEQNNCRLIFYCSRGQFIS